MATLGTNHFAPPRGPQPRLARYSCGNGSERWLIIANCHCIGLTKALCLLSEGLRIDAYLTTEFLKSSDNLENDLDSRDRILVSPPRRHNDPFERLGFTTRDNVWMLPILFFDGYHPDSTGVFRNGRSLAGVAGLHSLICFAAFQAGLDQRQAVALFNETVYERLGYFDRWDSARDDLFSHFSQHGFEIKEAFLRWTRTGPFMHTASHPRIHCLRDIAVLVLERFGIATQPAEALPPDDLADGAIWPVYRELALRLGVAGGYRFKPSFQAEMIDLSEFVDRSFELYRRHEGLALPPARQPVADALREIIGWTTTPI